MRILILIVLSTLLMVGCTRETSERTKVAIQIPASLSGNGALSTEVLKHIVINVSGSGMSQFVYSWDASNSGGFPDVFTFEFEQGSGRLVQALIVFEDSDTGMMNFYYGDAGVDFNASIVNVDVPISKLTSGYNASGNISGRYLTTDTTGPTGPVKITYKPSGKPAMLIEQSYIYNGWFNLFSLSEIEFTYSLADGTVLFGAPMMFSNTSMLPDSNGQIFKMQIPAYKEKISPGVFAEKEPRVKSFGWFFGSGVSSSVRTEKTVCLDNLANSVSGALKYNDTSSSISLQSQSQLNPVEDLFDLQNVSSLVSIGQGVYTGGTISGACASGVSSASEYQTQLTLDTNLIAKFNEGGELVLGPLRMYDRTQNIAVPVSGTNLTFQLLPGAELAVDQIRIYPVSSSLLTELKNTDNKNFPCGRVVGLSYVSAASSTTAVSVDLSPLQSIFSADPSAGRALCFFKDGNMIPSGVLVYSGSYGSTVPYLRVELAATWNAGTEKYEIGRNTCTPVQFRSYIGYGNTYAVSQAATVSGLSTAAAAYSFYSDSGCTTPASSSVTFGIGDSAVSAPIYMKAFSSYLNDIQFTTLSVSGGSGMTFTPSQNMFDINF